MRSRFLLFLVALLMLGDAWAQEDEILLYPADVGLGAELLVAISAQVPDEELSLRLVSASGDEQSLGTTRMGRDGSALARIFLPDVPPGNYQVVLQGPRAVIASTDLRVNSQLIVSLDKTSGVGNEFVAVQVAGAVPGHLEVAIDGTVVIGPLPVTQETFVRQIPIPLGGQAVLEVTAINRVGNRVMAVASTAFDRQRTEQDRVMLTQFDLPPRTLRRGELNVVSGQMILPDGTVPSDFEWTMVWITERGDYIPINVEPIAFGSGNKGGGFSFSSAFVVPSVKANYPFYNLNEQTDELGFVYANPKTGQSDEVRFDGVFPYDDEQGVVITGRVEDSGPIPAPIADAIVTVEAETVLLDPNTLAPVFDVKASGPVNVSSAAALQLENQISDAMKSAFNTTTVTGCPITLAVQQTESDGTYQIAFSPEQTAVLSLLRDRVIDPISGTFVPTGTISRDEFKVRVSGLHLDPGFGIAVNPLLPESFTGVRYDFRRRKATGLYEFRENLDGDFFCCFEPTDTLVTSLNPLPAGVELEIQSDIRIDGLDSRNTISNPDGPGDVDVFERLITFPSQVKTLGQETIQLHMDWASATLGPFDGVVKFDGLPDTALLTTAADPCQPGGVTYTANIPSLAVQPGGVLTGRIEGAAGPVGFYRNIQIVLAEGPTWFESPSYLQPVSIQWSPERIEITATELPKKTDASRDSVPLDVGDLDNTNEEPGSKVKQFILAGDINQQVRLADLAVTAFNEGSSPIVKAFRLDYAGPKPVEYKREMAVQPLGLPMGLCDIATLLPDVGACDPITLIDTGSIPLFRYAWGVPPIASAVLGADYYFKALLLFVGVQNFTDVEIVVDTLTEPSVDTGIEVFFDFSAVFGLVSASMSATPNVGVGMPIVVSDNAFNESESLPCFQFRLKLKFAVSVGPCPLCIEASYTDTPVKIREPGNCSILSQSNKGLPAAVSASADRLGIATNGVGKSLVIRTDSQGVKVQNVLAGNVGVDHLLDSGMGASRPDVAFLSTNRAVAVWSQSGLSASEYQAKVDADYECTEADVEADPGCNQQENFDGTQGQHMVYSVLDADVWGPTQNLTLPNTGEGGVRLAACPSSNAQCPTGGEVLAVWHRDMAGDLNQNQIKLYYAFFDGTSWSTPQAIDPSNSQSKDVQPAPIYADGEPMVVWVRNDSVTPTGEVDLANRELKYQFLNLAAGVRTVGNVPSSVASPSLTQAANGSLVLAFTSSNANAPFVGSRRALYVATTSNCSAGVCLWFGLKQKDQFGRDVFIEQPSIVMDGNDNVVIAFRWLGAGGALQPSDPFGITGYGNTAVMQAQLPEIGNTNVNISPLSIDNNLNWQTAAVFDPAIDAMMVVSAQADQAVQQKSAAYSQTLGGVRRQKLAGDRPVTLFGMPALPNIKVERAIPIEGSVVTGDDVITVKTTVVNMGTPLLANDRLTIDVYLDGPPGVGSLLGTASGLTLADPKGTDFDVSVDIPSGVSADESHTLTVIVTPPVGTLDADADDNQIVVALNALPVPNNIEYFLDRAATTPIIRWDDPQDSRVTGYRIYRRDASDSAGHQIGLSPVPGFADVLAVPQESYEYCVTAMSRRAGESACSEWLPVALFSSSRAELLFANGFEQ